MPVANRLHVCAGEISNAAHSRSAGSDAAPSPSRAGFSVLELLFVLTIATAITALLMPVFSLVRESAQRVICASNERQIGMAMIMYYDANNDRLPPSAYGTVEHPEFRQQDMMAAHRGGNDPLNWEGIGILYQQHYCSSPECFYCPSHRGMHSFDRYEDWYPMPFTSGMIFTNYHYAGDFDRDELEISEAASGFAAQFPLPRRRMLEAETVLLTDGMRTVRDFNHFVGSNVLRGDGSVRWRDDDNEIYPMLPAEEMAIENNDALFTDIWNIIIADEE